MFSRLTIRNRIAGGSLLISLLISLAAGIVLNAQLERIVREGSVAVLRSDSAAFVGALQSEPGETLDAPGPAQAVAVVAPDGSTPVNTLPAGVAALLPTLLDSQTVTMVDLDSASYLVLSTPVTVDSAEWHVVAARSAHEEQTVLGQMRLLLLAGLATIVLGTTVTAWMLTSAALAPVRRLRASAEELSAEPLSTMADRKLLPVASAHDEISDLANTLNQLIERMRASAARERQLVSDASHELRTPLAILTTQLQLAAAEASSVDQLLDDVEGARRNVARMTRLVNSMLELSALEAHNDQPALCTAEALEREGADAIERARFRAGDLFAAAGQAPSIEYETSSTPDAARYPISAEAFGRILDNLLSNALAAMRSTRGHEARGRISARLAFDADALRLTVSDTGGGLSADFVQHAFERFSRDAEARSVSNGTGLGLAIVAAIVANARGTVELQNIPGAGLTVQVLIPSSKRAERETASA